VIATEPERVENFPQYSKAAQDKGVETALKISGRFELGLQYHYTMETQSCVSVPIEDGIDVYSATQWMDTTQMAVAEMLNIPNNVINMYVRRLGGGYGAKISRGNQIACACSLAAYLLSRPVRFILKIEANMSVVGKRYACINYYDAMFDHNGKIQELNTAFTEDFGCSKNEPGENFANNLKINKFLINHF
jgi:xanthine dehydrogenase/oxidase